MQVYINKYSLPETVHTPIDFLHKDIIHTNEYSFKDALWFLNFSFDFTFQTWDMCPRQTWECHWSITPCQYVSLNLTINAMLCYIKFLHNSVCVCVCVCAFYMNRKLLFWDPIKFPFCLLTKLYFFVESRRHARFSSTFWHRIKKNKYSPQLTSNEVVNSTLLKLKTRSFSLTEDIRSKRPISWYKMASGNGKGYSGVSF